MLREDEVRKKVKVLKRFYMDVVTFGIVNIVLILIWLTLDRTGMFWPKYVIVIWGIFLFSRAYRMGVMPFIFHRVAFLGQDWEDKKVREIMRQKNINLKNPAKREKKEK